MNVEAILALKGRHVHTIPSAAPILDAVREMMARQVGALVVSDDGSSIEGIASDRDVVRLLAEEGPGSLTGTIGDVMTRQVLTCRPDDRVMWVMNLMTQERIRHVPVVDESNRLCGLVSIGDLVKNRLDEIQTEAESMREYITRSR